MQVSGPGRAGLCLTDAAPDARDGYKRGNTLFFHNYNKSCRLIPGDHAWEGTQYTILFTVKMEFKGLCSLLSLNKSFILGSAAVVLSEGAPGAGCGRGEAAWMPREARGRWDQCFSSSVWSVSLVGGTKWPVLVECHGFRYKQCCT